MKEKLLKNCCCSFSKARKREKNFLPGLTKKSSKKPHLLSTLGTWGVRLWKKSAKEPKVQPPHPDPHLKHTTPIFGRKAEGQGTDCHHKTCNSQGTVELDWASPSLPYHPLVCPLHYHMCSWSVVFMGKTHQRPSSWKTVPVALLLVLHTLP